MTKQGLPIRLHGMLVPGQSEKSAASTDAARWRECEDAAGLALAILAFTGAIGVPVTLPLAAAGVFIALAKFRHNESQRLADDPPDPAFEEPVQVKSWLRVNAFGPEDQIGPLGEAARVVADQVLYLQAMVTAIERAQAASEAGDADAAQTRTAEALGYGRRLVGLLLGGRGVLFELAEALEAAAPRERQGHPGDRVVLEARLLHGDPIDELVGGLSTALLAMLFRSGLSVTDLSFDAARATADPTLVERLMAWPAGELARALRQAAESSASLGSVLEKWLGAPAMVDVEP